MSDALNSGVDIPQPPTPPGLAPEEAPDTSFDQADALKNLALDAAREASGWKSAPGQKNCRSLEQPLREASETINAAVGRLRARAAGGESLPGDGRSLVDNRRLMRSAVLNVQHALETCQNLPHVDHEGRPRDPVPRVYAAAAAYLRATNHIYRERTLRPYLEAIQECGALELAELWSLQPMLQLGILREIAQRAPSGGGSSDTAPHPPAQPIDRLSRLIASLRETTETDWKLFVEQMSSTERTLHQDPAGAYPRMDAESRSQYRGVIRKMARRSKFSETEIAKEAIALSRATETEWNSEPRRAERHSHVGYYLVDGGQSILEHQIGYRPTLSEQIRDAVRRRPDAFYLLGIELLTFAVMAFVLNGLGASVPLIWALLLLLIPATESAIGAMNQLVSFLLPPQPLPKLDFSAGIPFEFTTMVVVPTLLMNEQQVRQIVHDLELRYLGNHDPNLHFALLTDFPDSPQPPRERGTLVDLCSKLVEELNDRYRSRGAGTFYLFHRDLVYNPVESTWMGWERKRGKIMDFNNLLRGVFDSFPVKIGDLSVLPKVRYVITLDTDTQLPRDSARRLVGTLAHPLNRAVIDPATNTVVEGYGILQPRIGISVRSVNRSRLASIYSGEAGLDAYARAVSDVYQDLMDEGSFTGKGIYEVEVFQRVLANRFPLNTILSHDLIEGAYARAGLVSDIELIDDYPSHFSAYSRRKHRWVRGDWQIMRWLLPRVPDHTGRLVPNPISTISKWKILDNLRRSMVEPATFVLLLAGWFFLSGGPTHWTVAVLALLLIPAYFRLALSITNLPRAGYLPGFLAATAEAFVTDQVNVFMLLAFLAHQVLVALDAIVRTVVRLTITRRRLLEWETAAEAEAGVRRTPVDLYLELTPLLSIVIALLLLATRPAALPLAAPILVLWACSGLLSRWLNRPLRPGTSEITRKDEEFLRTVALKTWRYFRQFSNDENHWLTPDTVQADPLTIIQKISPTNLGLLLNARIAAYELGYLSPAEFATVTERTLSTMRDLRRYRGHFFNWYDNFSLEPLQPAFVSTVDSGNLATCLWTLKQTCLEMVERPVEDAASQGLGDHLRLVVELARGLPLEGAAASAASDLLNSVIEGAAPTDLTGLQRSLAVLGDALQHLDLDQTGELRYWIQEASCRVSILRTPSGEDAGLASRLRSIAAECDAFVQEMDFSFLYRPEKKVLSIGYDVGHRRVEKSCYDLLASEARTAAFVAIAKGDLAQESWFYMGRTLGVCHGRRTLMSWSGTLFEYLMPTVWMKTYPKTLLDQTVRSAVHCQRKAGMNRGIPWGISESGCSRKNDLGHYMYHAFGLRSLALRPDMFSATVISPYSSCLALAVNTSAAVENLRRMHDLGWRGDYGFYEAADYSAVQDDKPGRAELVRSWMAHHQGMSLLAACNLLAASAIRNLFHAEPMVAATERLLQEKIPRVLAIEPPETQQV
jgi:cyclic beta-1,2-glucan synthetase